MNRFSSPIIKAGSGVFKKKWGEPVPALGQISPPQKKLYVGPPLAASKMEGKGVLHRMRRICFYTYCDCVRFCIYVAYPSLKSTHVF